MTTPDTLKPVTVTILKESAADYWRLTDELEAARLGLTSAVLDAKLEGMPVKDIVTITRWSRTQVNSIKHYPTSADQPVSTTEQPLSDDETVTDQPAQEAASQ
jgi:hypothetical protein